MKIVKDMACCPKCKEVFEWSFFNPNPQAIGWVGKLEPPKHVKRFDDLGDRFSIQLQCLNCNCRFPIEKMKG